MHIDRRRFLLGSGGAVLALPWLESLARAQTARPLRLLVMFHFQGLVRTKWSPPRTGALPATGNISEILSPIGSVTRQRMTIVSGLGNVARHIVSGDNHRRSNTTILTNAEPQSDTLAGGPSLDQAAVPYLRAGTPRPSILLPASADDVGQDVFFSRTSSGLVSPVSLFPINPRAAAQTLFAQLPTAGTTPPPRPTLRERMSTNRRSVVDAVAANLRTLRAQLDPTDRARLDAHAEHLHALSQRFPSMQPGQPAQPISACTAPDPAAIPNLDDDGWQVQGMRDDQTAPAQIDNLVRAFACDLTRVAGLYFNSGHDPRFPWLFGGDSSAVIRGRDGQRYTSWHDMIHLGQPTGQDSDPGVANLVRGQRFYAEMFDLLVRRLAETPDIDGTSSVLDNTLVLWMTDFGDENHGTSDIPVVLAGLNDRVPRGQHISAAGRPMGDLFATVLRILGAPSGTTLGRTGSVAWNQLADTWAFSGPRPDRYFTDLLPLA